MRRFLAVAVILCASLAQAAEPVAKVVVPERPIAGDLIILDASQSQGDQFDWVLEGSDKPILPVEKATKCVFTTRYGGTFRFLFLAVGVAEDGTAKLVKERITLEIEGPSPPGPGPGPGPSPGPDPRPDPSPDPRPTPVVTGRLYVSFILPGEPTPAQNQIRTSATLRSRLVTLDAAFRAYQENESDLERLHLADRVREIGVPCAFVQTKDGAIVAVIQQPTVDSILKSVSDLRGK